MRIKQINITGLFDRFNHQIPFNLEDRVTIILGPNGSGKTVSLTAINLLFKCRFYALARLPFKELEVIFSNGTKFTAARKHIKLAEKSKLTTTRIECSYQNTKGNIKNWVPHHRRIKPSFPLSIVEDVIEDLTRIEERKWRSHQTSEIFDLHEVLELYSEVLPHSQGISSLPTPAWIKELLSKIPLSFIDTERLTIPAKPQKNIRYAHRDHLLTPLRSVMIYSNKLGEQIRDTLTEYGSLSQSLDRTLPIRVMKPNGKGKTLAVDRLKKKLEDIEIKRENLIASGLLTHEEIEGWNLPSMDEIQELQIQMLSVLAEDSDKKLGVFDDLYEKVSLFGKIINDRFIHKHIIFSDKGMQVFTDEGVPLDLTLLSSGEQQEIILFYELLFNIEKDSLLLIDEPEISLHVAWQKKIVEDFLKIAELRSFDLLLATHSPQIIGDRWDLTVELTDPKS